VVSTNDAGGEVCGSRAELRAGCDRPDRHVRTRRRRSGDARDNGRRTVLQSRALPCSPICSSPPEDGHPSAAREFIDPIIFVE